MITPTFHFKILEGYLEVFSEKSEILVRTLQKEVGSQSFDIYPYINRCTLDIICGEVFLVTAFQYLENTLLCYYSRL
jgi:cytochrome P450